MELLNSYNQIVRRSFICQAQRIQKDQLLRLDQLQDRTGVGIKMENGEKKEMTRENPVVIRKTSNEDNLVLRHTRNDFYGGIDLQFSKIRVISDNPIIIE